ncbi:hypothetical protein [Chitinophaga sp. Cy-1792]|uniref:hypothetical protein n=1 Tax=Chitinophaga sp. Cy-1792 TaxID=2608339 RepID=UPI001420F1D5|nr:hypothetical protein [Chitinophaga sp. Cy-1792]NIG56950.1 hypothetical protein [Chitinophaga sp. Cy-1792]
MEAQFENLLQYWKSLLSPADSISLASSQVQTTLYSDGSRYKLDDYTKTGFPAGGPMLAESETMEGHPLDAWGLNADGLPCYTRAVHAYNQLVWEGYYQYSENQVAYIEYCINTGLPSKVQRLTFEGDKKISAEWLSLNGRGSMENLTGYTPDEMVEELRNDAHTLIVNITRYDYDQEGKISQASHFYISPGGGQFTAHSVYNYDQHHQLDNIRQFFENGSRLTYSKLSAEETPETIVARMAEVLAGAILRALKSATITEPLALLELGYRYVDSYIPLLTCIPAADFERSLKNGESTFPPEYDAFLQVDELPFEQLYSKLETLMEEMDDYELGRTMIRLAARHLTANKLEEMIPVTEDFCAYAVDWSIEGHDNENLKEILLECGVSETVVNKWEDAGLLG